MQETLVETKEGKVLPKFTKEEVYESTLNYFKGDTLATEVWINKYCLRDSDENLYEKNPDDMHKRLAKEFARIESKYPNPLSEEKIFEKIKNFKKIVPQGSPMAGIGNNFQVVSLSNCFVIGNEADSYGGIMRLDQELVQLQKRRAGVGLDLSFIRPTDSPVKNSAITSTGIVPFMERYSNSTREVAQGGRRGALMETIHIKHPDSENFIDAKTIKGKVTGANVSVRIDDDFMKAAIHGTTYTTQYPIESISHNIKYIKEINANKLWKKIIHNAWQSAEPGILFWDTILRESIPDCYADLGFKTISTNPCGEITLCANDSCRLLAINLYGYVVRPFQKTAYFDWGSFIEDVMIAERLMDDIVDLELEKIDKILEKIDSDPEPDNIKETERNLWLNIKDKAQRGRRTGLGVTGEGDMLAALGLIYGTDEATDFSEQVHQTLKLGAYRSSVAMAKERGAFPIFDAKREINNPFIQRIKEEDNDLWKDMQKYGRRNLALLTIAPTGSVSILTQTTSGIECAFLVYYFRRRKINPHENVENVDFIDGLGDHWIEYTVFHHKFEEWLKVNEYDVNDIKKNWNKDQIAELVKKSPYYKATSNDVDWVKKVKMQGRIQKHVDHSISVTVNLPKDITEETVSKVYETGWKANCKGITVYRDGSRDGVLITESEKAKKKEVELFKENHYPKRPKRLKADIHRFQNNLEKWIAVVGLKDGRPYEIFTGRLENGLSKLPTSILTCEVVKNRDEQGNKSYDIEYIDSEGNKEIHVGLNHTFNPEFWNYAKMISAVMRQGMPTYYIYLLVNSLNLADEHLNTWKNGVARVIKRYIKDGEQAHGTCPQCGSDSLEFIEGCLTCKSCGNSKCG